MFQSVASQINVFQNASGPFVVAVESTRMAMIFTDAQDGFDSIVFANDSFLRMTGFEREQVLGRSAAVVLGEVTDPVTSTSIQAALAAGEAGTWEMQCHRKDGADFLASVLLSPVRDQNGVLCQNFMSFYPLGERFDRLLNKHNAFQALYQQAPGFIAIAEGPDHRITFANRSFKHFVGIEVLEGLTASEAMPEIVAQGFSEILDRVYQTGDPYRGENVPFDIKDPETGLMVRRYADFIYQPVRDADYVVTGIFCEGYDVTEIRDAATALRTSQTELIHVSRVNAMGTMATTLAHELNQPLSAIANYAAGALRLVEPRNHNAQLVAQALHAIDQSARRASAIIRALRDLTERRVPAREAFNIKRAVQEAINLVRISASPDITIIDKVPANLTVHADPIQMQQVIINLLRNACGAVETSERREVTIAAFATPDDIVVSVCDTGGGVSLEAAQGIFTWSDSATEGGMGLGLSICRTIVEAHRGRIWLERSGSDGAEFRFSIPTAPIPASQRLN